MCQPIKRQITISTCSFIIYESNNKNKRNNDNKTKLEDLKVLRRSPDLLNDDKIGQGQLQLITEQILFLPYTFWSSDLNNQMNNPSNSPVISEKKMFR